MAFVHDYSDATKNLGRWFAITRDEERHVQVSLRIRRLGREERRRIEKPFLRSRKGRRGMAKSLEVPSALMEEFGIECALWMWTDVRNGYVKVHDEKVAKFYADQLGQKVEVKSDVRLDGKLSREIKLRLIDQDNAIATFITDKGILIDEDATEEDEQAAEVQEVAAENLSNG